MKIKPDPKKALHYRRKRELKFILPKFPKGVFPLGLELGAGDGFQSTILAHYTQELISTDYSTEKLPIINLENIKYQQCDAEKVADYFEKETFDLIFSSSMVEHLIDKKSFLNGMHSILKDQGIAIHIMPNRFWKLSHMTLHHFNYLILILEKIFRIKSLKAQYPTDNPKKDKKYPALRRILWPIPHGADKNNIEEFLNFGKKRWIELFEKNGFDVKKVIKGPVSSGYSLGFNKLRAFLEKIGLSSTFIYILTKKNQNSDYLKYIE